MKQWHLRKKAMLIIYKGYGTTKEAFKETNIDVADLN